MSEPVTLWHKFLHRIHMFHGTVWSCAFYRGTRGFIIIGYECATCGRLSGVHVSNSWRMFP